MARVNGKVVAGVAAGVGLLFLFTSRESKAAQTAGLATADPVGPPEPDPNGVNGQGAIAQPPPPPPIGEDPLGGLSGGPQEPDVTDGYGPVNAPDIVGPWLSDVPMARRFYTVKQGNTLRGVARVALGVNYAHPGINPAMRCIAGTAWNLSLYGTPCDPNQEPCQDSVPVEGETLEWDIRQGFLPSHVNAVAAMFTGVMPERVIGYEPQSQGQTTGNYGTLWIPAMSYNDETGEVICEGDIPPAVAALLQFGV